MYVRDNVFVPCSPLYLAIEAVCVSLRFVTDVLQAICMVNCLNKHFCIIIFVMYIAVMTIYIGVENFCELC